MTEISRCRSCGESIWWLRNDSTGRMAPIEAADPDNRGNVLVDLEAGTYRVLSRGVATPGGRALHLNHFARCREAAQWKRA